MLYKETMPIIIIILFILTVIIKTNNIFANTKEEYLEKLHKRDKLTTVFTIIINTIPIIYIKIIYFSNSISIVNDTNTITSFSKDRNIIK